MTSDNPQVSVPSAAPQQIIVQPQPTAFGRYGKWMFTALVLMGVALVSLFGKYQSYFSPAGGPQEKYHSLDKAAAKKIAIISVDGPIFSGEDSFTKNQIDRVRSDADVVAVVLRINSPGGGVAVTDYLYHHLRKLAEERQLPIVVSMGGLCASGGYYLAMSVGTTENAIFAEPTTWTGSIGVMIPHYDFSDTIAALKIKDDSLASGPHKLAGSFTRDMTPEQRELFQGLVDDGFRRFKEIILGGRPRFKENPAALDAVATGQIFTSKQAADKGLVDRIGFIEDAIARASELAGVSKSEVRCVKYDRPPSLFGGLLSMSGPAAARQPTELSVLFQLATPRAYYLWGGLPVAVSNSPRE
jgi:protease-4